MMSEAQRMIKIHSSLSSPVLYIPADSIFTSPRQSISLEVCIGILDYYGYYLVFCHHRIPIDIKPRKNAKQYECEEDEYQGIDASFVKGDVSRPSSLPTNLVPRLYYI